MHERYSYRVHDTLSLLVVLVFCMFGMFRLQVSDIDVTYEAHGKSDKE